MADLVDKLDNDELKNIAESIDLVDAAAEIVKGAILVGMNEHHEGVSLTRHILLALEEVSNDLRRVGHEEVEVLVDGEDGEDGIASHVRVLVLKALTNRGHERLEQLGLLELAEEAQRRAFDELVRVLQVLAVRVAHEDHLLHELAVRRVLRHDLPEDKQQLLYGVIRHWHYESYDGHQ